MRHIRWPKAWAARPDTLLGLALALVALGLYIATLLPGIGRRDTAEFQWVAPTLGLAHPTGYPLYTMLGWVWSKLPLGESVAWRMNLFSALAASGAVGLLYALARETGQRRIAALGAAAVLAVSRTFWSQATIAEVYALALLLQTALFLALVRWRAGTWPLWAAGLIAGLALAHHRTSVLLLPGAALFLLLSRRPRLAELLGALLALVLGCLTYLYLLLHLPPNGDLGQFLWTYAVGSDLASNWLDPARLMADGWARIGDLASRFVLSQLHLVGLVLALVGALVLVARDHALAALLLLTYGLVAVFCAAYYVDDVEVFLLPMHLIAAVLLGGGASVLMGPDNQEPRSASNGVLSPSVGIVSPQALPGSLLGSRSLAVGFTLVALPIFLFVTNLPAIRAENTIEPEAEARAIIVQGLPQGTLVIGDWYATEGLRYLQTVERRRPDIELSLVLDRSFILDQLARQRAVYLLDPQPTLGLAQAPEGGLWRVSQQPLDGETQFEAHWNEGLTLRGFTLHSGPYHAGDTVPLTLNWRTSAVSEHGYRLFVHLVTPDGRIAGQHDREPSAVPTSQWAAGEAYVDLYAPMLDPKTRPGRYLVNIGWYDPSTGQRLALNDGGDYLTLGVIDVVR